MSVATSTWGGAPRGRARRLHEMPNVVVPQGFTRGKSTTATTGWPHSGSGGPTSSVTPHSLRHQPHGVMQLAVVCHDVGTSIPRCAGR